MIDPCRLRLMTTATTSINQQSYMKILVGMSGGIDSTYAAIKLKNEGHTVEGAVLVMHEYTELDEAIASAEEIGIPIHTVDAREAFSSAVIPDFINEYTNGRTPNPCIICNSEVKFALLLRYALENGFDAIATGHYAKIVMLDVNGQAHHAVARAKDEKKDQSYMLYRLGENILSRLILPLGDMTKDEVHSEARALGLSSVNRGESQEICFIPDNDYASYIEARVGESAPGEFVDENGNILGVHKGIIHYTVGQRKGLGISAAARIFVTDIDPKTGRITLSYETGKGNTVFVSRIKPCDREMYIKQGCEYLVRLRYHAPLVPCIITSVTEEGIELTLPENARASSPGQSAVIYEGDAVLFGGIITRHR